MLNITFKLALFSLCGALLTAASNPSHASNVYSAAPSHDEAGVAQAQPRYFACPTVYSVCPTEAPTITAKAGDQSSRTDAPVSDTPEQSSWSQENEQRYYDYSRVIISD